MAINSEELIQKLSAAQPQIWQSVSTVVSEASDESINFGSPLTVSSRTSDLYSEMSSPKVIIQFAFANLPENPQVIIVSQETFAELANMLREAPVEELDDNVLADIRPVFEAIVQGLCLAVGNLLNEPVVASGMSIRFQIVSLPPNIQRSDSIIRTNVSISCEQVSGTVIWAFDNETAHAIIGEVIEEDAETPFAQVVQDESIPHLPLVPSSNDNGLDILMDIPLEISVELGRVRMMVKEVIELGSGSIVEIDKAAGEPVDIMVNGRLVAKGEVVVIEDNFGVRITEILSPAERLMRLNEAA